MKSSLQKISTPTCVLQCISLAEVTLRSHCWLFNRKCGIQPGAGALNIHLFFPFAVFPSGRLSLLYKCPRDMQLSFSMNVADLGLCLTVILFLSIKQSSWSWTTAWKALGPPFISITQSTNDMLIKKSLLMAWPCSVRSGFNVRISLTELLRINSFLLAGLVREDSSLNSWMWGESPSTYLYQLPPATVQVLLKSLWRLKGPPVLVPALCMDANRPLRTVNCLVCQDGNLLPKMGYDL